MNSRRQILVSAALVAGALGTVGLYSVLAAPPEQGGGMEGHDHAAMQAAAGSAPQGQPVTLDAEAARRIGVTYAVARRGPVRLSVQTVGTVTYDETRLATVNPKLEGWIERLHVEFTGAPVRRGQPLMEVYSPMLVSAQEELILARRLVDRLGEGASERAAANAGELLESARRRLRYWDVPEGEIRRIEASGAPRRTVTLTAPAGGIVVEKNAVQGSRIMPGMDLFRIADLSRVWVDGEVFEKDLALVRRGQTARVTFKAYPGETFTGTVSYLYPSVSLEARTGRVRVELDNPGLRLMPGMYAQVELEADPGREALMVPRGAVHATGQRALVFVRQDGGALVPREVVAGHVAGDQVEILSGLAEGETVVASANFLIDAESNMGSSMGAMPGMDHGAPPAAAPSTAADPHAGHAMPAAPDPHAGH